VQRFQNVAIADPSEPYFGSRPQPLTTRRGLVIGGGMVYPELNFAPPAMLVQETTMAEVGNRYRQIITGAVQRAVELEAPGPGIEFETLPPMPADESVGDRRSRCNLAVSQVAGGD